MSTINTKIVEQNLKKKGFVNTEGKKHKVFTYKHNGKLTSIKTHTSHNRQDIGDNLLSMMGKQVGLSQKQFYDFASCVLSEEQYKAILKKKNIL